MQKLNRYILTQGDKGYDIHPAVFVIDVQNCFMSPEGSYGKMKFKVDEYRKIIPTLKSIIKKSQSHGMPLFFSRAIREASGIDNLDRVHKILPAKRKERINKAPLCIRGTWDGDLIDEVKNKDANAHIVDKRRDSAFQGTEFNIWLKALQIDTLIIAGVDTAICVESTLRDAFNIGYDVILLSDGTASLNPIGYTSTINEVEENFGLVMTSDQFFNNIKKA
jgi:ureidoacrylate peracid hydrolase